jgi:hypothetical protein
MAVYTVYQPRLRAEQTSPDPERFAFIRDGFSFAAFLFGPLWLLWHRLWLAFIFYLVVTIGLGIAVGLLTRSAAATAAVGLLIALLMGFEATTSRRWTLARRGWRNSGVIVSDDLESAERRFFDVWVKAHDAGPAPSVPPLAPSTPPRGSMRNDVIGLFPEPGATR